MRLRCGSNRSGWPLDREYSIGLPRRPVAGFATPRGAAVSEPFQATCTRPSGATAICGPRIVPRAIALPG